MSPRSSAHPSPRTATVLAALTVLLASLWLAACGGSGEGGGPAATDAVVEEAAEPDAEVIAVQVATVQREPVSSIYSTSSTLRADKQATVIARTDGVVRRLVVEEGDRVEEGRVLAVLEDDEQKIEFDRTRANYEIEKREFERSTKLYADDLVSYEEHEADRRELEEAKQAYARAELELNRTVVRAPFAGQILRRHLDVGATVSDGTPVYDLADVRPLYADVNVPERHVARLAVGQTVRLVADASQTQASAVIERIAPSVDPSTGTVKVTLAVDAADARLRPGAFVRASIVTETHPEALVVPRSALVAEGRRWHLFRLDSTSGQVEQIEVLLGFEEGDRVEISDHVDPERVLDPGDRVVVVGAPALSEGASVQIVDDATGEVDEEPPEEETSGEPA